MQSVFPHDDFEKKILRRKRSSSSRKRRPHVGKFNRSGIEVCVQPGFSPNLVDTLTYGNVCADGSKAKTWKVDKFFVDVPHENSVHDCLRADQDIYADGSSSLPPKHADGRNKVCLSDTQVENCSYAIRNEVSLSSSEFGDFISSNVDGEIAGCGDEDEVKSPFYDRIEVNAINGENVEPFTLDMEIDLENRIEKLERVVSKLKEARFGQKVEKV